MICIPLKIKILSQKDGKNMTWSTTGKTYNKTCNKYYIIEKSQIMDSISMTTLIK